MSFTSTIVLYLSVLIVCMFFCYVALKKNNKLILLFPIIILSLLAGLRHWSVGTDTYAYMISLDSFFETGTQLWYYNTFATGYGYFVKFIYSIFFNYNFLLTVEALIINALIIYRLWDFKDKTNFLTMIFLYLMIIYLRIFNLNVQYIAIALIFYATRFIEKKQNIKFIIVCIIASTIHKSAVICLGYVILEWLKGLRYLNKNKFIMIVPTLFLGGFTLVYIGQTLLTKYGKYFISYGGSKTSIGLMVFVQLFVFLFTYFLCSNSIKKSDKKRPFNEVSLYYFIGIILSFSSYIVKNAGRISYYFMIFEIVYYGMILANKKLDKFIRFLILFWLAFYAIYVMVDTANGWQVFPYSFFWM